MSKKNSKETSIPSKNHKKKPKKTKDKIKTRDIELGADEEDVEYF